MEHRGSYITWGILVDYNEPGTTLVPPFSVLYWAEIVSIFCFSLHCGLMINHTHLVQCVLGTLQNRAVPQLIFCFGATTKPSVCKIFGVILLVSFLSDPGKARGFVIK